MKIALIAAMSENGVIGVENKLPWHLPEELKYFRTMTKGKPVIMGRKTFESIGSKPLPHRLNIILTKSDDFIAAGCTVVHTVADALQAVGDCEEVMVVGGAEIYKAFLVVANRLYLTTVHGNYPGDVYFPAIEWEDWQLTSSLEAVGFTAKVWDKKWPVSVHVK